MIFYLIETEYIRRIQKAKLRQQNNLATVYLEVYKMKATQEEIESEIRPIVEQCISKDWLLYNTHVYKFTVQIAKALLEKFNIERKEGE